MTTLREKEALYWQHIEDGDQEGAAQHLLTPDEILRQSADKYLDDVIESGYVIESRIVMSHYFGKFVGYTTVETNSGVVITKTSGGNFAVTAEYEEGATPDKPNNYQDLTVEIDLPTGGTPVVAEDRRRVVDGYYTGEGGSKTLPRSEGERVMGQVAKLIWQIF